MGKKKSKDSVGRPCPYCRRVLISAAEAGDTWGRKATIEHIKTRADGGDNDPSNLLIVCERCNNLRGDLDYDIFCAFARGVIQQYPDAPTIVLRKSLRQFVASLAEIAIRNPRAKNKALGVAILDLGRSLENAP